MSGQPLFRFRQFAVRHERAAMKVGTDGVLLGSVAGRWGPEALTILDIGTGSGLLALMLAQRYPSARVTGVELDPEAARQAEENAEASPFGGRIHIICADVRRLELADVGAFELAVSNPPYFGGLGCPDQRRQAARHTDTLRPGELLDAAIRLLRPGGALDVILPADQREGFAAEATTRGLYLDAALTVSSTNAKPPRRVVLHLVYGHDSSRPCFEQQLTLLQDNGDRTKEYGNLTKEFYIL